MVQIADQSKHPPFSYAKSMSKTFFLFLVTKRLLIIGEFWLLALVQG